MVERTATNRKNSKRKVKKESTKETRKKSIREMLVAARDIAISAGIVILVLVSLYAYTGIWPPMVVIESNSMMHGDDSQIGIIDTGDLALVKSIRDRHDIVTYVEASCATDPHHGLKTYGDFGNVIVYRKNGLDETPVIHRAIAWIEYNASASDPPRSYHGDIPDMHVYNVIQYDLKDVGYQDQEIIINMHDIFSRSAKSTSRAPHGGFVTHGDHNGVALDQVSLEVSQNMYVEPVLVDWVVGRAEGELPWFGLFKLWISGQKTSTFPETSGNGLVITVILIISVPISIDLIISLRRKRKCNRQDLRKKARKRGLN